MKAILYIERSPNLSYCHELLDTLSGQDGFIGGTVVVPDHPDIEPFRVVTFFDLSIHNATAPLPDGCQLAEI